LATLVAAAALGVIIGALVCHKRIRDCFALDGSSGGSLDDIGGHEAMGCGCDGGAITNWDSSSKHMSYNNCVIGG
jgi:hypothetical protein